MTTRDSVTLTREGHTFTYTPALYGTGRLFVCDCGLETDDGAVHHWHNRK